MLVFSICLSVTSDNVGVYGCVCVCMCVCVCVCVGMPQTLSNHAVYVLLS